jgi:hypothetical protein
MSKDLYKEFLNPGCEYRGKPFWSWNGRLEEKELTRQINVMKDMGLGGFFMHSRTGLVTEYLGDEWFQLTNACADAGEKLGMEAWLYDEDRWPSGTAGGMVTENPEYRLKFLSLRQIAGSEFQWNDKIYSAFSCLLNGLYYSDCSPIQMDTPKSSYQDKTVLIFTVEEAAKSSFYNGWTDVDRLKKEATDEYIHITHDQYKKHCGDRFGKSILGIFTDEPNRGALMTGFANPDPNRHWMTPWTEKIPEYFIDKFGYDILDRLPEIFLKPDGNSVSQVKWHYVELLQQLFLENFAKPIYDWCEANNLLLTGHVLHEDNLTSQVAMQGSLMRFYEYMHYSGVDVLTEGNRNYWIVKQLTSVARQLGQKWLLSELYGCTGWQMNFESHKAVGDWQALFGINLRCHHLSWYTMEGEAKRDYPASILHQSAWWKDYHHVETYYSRLGLILNQGEPCCDVLVISPIESLWCQIYAGWAESLSPLSPEIQALEKAYTDLFFWLAGSQIDFDYADEEMLGRLAGVERSDSGEPILRVGKAKYRSIVIGKMTTMRSSTLKILDEFIADGGEVIFVGETPDYVDALPSSDVAKLAIKAKQIQWDNESFLNAFDNRIVEIIDSKTGKNINEIFCQLRKDGKTKFLVAMNVNRDKAFEDVIIKIKGNGYVSEWNCLIGERFTVLSEAKGDCIEFKTNFPPSGEKVYVLTEEKPELPTKPEYKEIRSEICSGPYEYRLSEPNICVLDFARCKIDDGNWQDSKEVLKIDQSIRRSFDLPIRGGEMVQPWFHEKYMPKPQVKGKVLLSFDFDIEKMPSDPIYLCMEQPKSFIIKLNGKSISSTDDEWWVDIAFKKVKIPSDSFKMGSNELTLEVDFHEGINIEALYLIGDFGVNLHGTKKTLTSLPDKLNPSDVVSQGLPFYTGSIIYRLPVTVKPEKDEVAFLSVTSFESACLKVLPGDDPKHLIAWQPYEANITDILNQNSVIELEAVLTRRNTFGPLHQIPLKAGAYGPGSWTTEGRGFSEEYMLYPSGLLEAPVIKFAIGL